MRYIIYPYKMGSASARLLANGLEALRVYPNRRYRYRVGDVIVNWGNQYIPNWEVPDPSFVLNPLLPVALASDKLATLSVLRQFGVSVPEFTTQVDEARRWLQENCTVVRREILHGSGGRGIDILEGPEATAQDAPLFTKYVKKRNEYRIHVFKGRVIHIQEKRKRRGGEVTSTQVRNLSTGWVFCQDDVNPHDNVLIEATAAVVSLGLDFGAVDVIWNDYYEKAYVLEVNTAPGLEGTTLQKYIEAIQQFEV